MTKKYEVRILDAAWDDLLRIRNWYILNFSEDTANKIADAILGTLERLEIFPDFGSPTPDEWLNGRGYRMVVCKKHIAVYRKIGDVVYVYHIADSGTQYTKLFK